jgi:hypothetical protein
MEESIVPKNKKHVKAKGGATPPLLSPQGSKNIIALRLWKKVV